MEIPAQRKYGNLPTEYAGLRFDSKAEARRAQELDLLERGKAIRNLRRQVRFALHAPGGAQVGLYIADFAYTDCATGKEVVEDVKSTATAGLALFKWKARHLQAEYGIEVQVVLR